MARQGLGDAAALMVVGRVLNMALNVLMVPLLIHFLGGHGFALWALLLSCAAVFATLEIGIPTAFVKHLAVALGSPQAGASPFPAAASSLLVALYGALLPVVVLASPKLAAWFQLPDEGLLRSHHLIVFVYVAAALRSVLQIGWYSLFAERQFLAAAVLSFSQAFLSNFVATIAASIWRRVDAALFCFWAAQLLVCTVGWIIAKRRLGWRVGRDPGRRRAWGTLAAYGVKVQIQDWAQVVNFQFDKFVMLGAVGLWGVALYEVANRSALAIRSIPAAGMETFLPAAAMGVARGTSARHWYSSATILAGYGALLFILAPLAIAPVFLYAWVGEMGYVSRWAFLALAMGSACSLLAMPAGTLVQALDRPSIQAQCAAASILVNVPLSLTFVRVWGLEGAAFGTCVAMIVGAGLLLRNAHRLVGLSVGETLAKVVRRQWPLGLVCLAVGLVAWGGFSRWFLSTPVEARFLPAFRATAGAISAGLYVACVGAMAAAKGVMVGWDFGDRRVAVRWRKVLAKLRRSLASAE